MITLDFGDQMRLETTIDLKIGNVTKRTIFRGKEILIDQKFILVRRSLDERS